MNFIKNILDRLEKASTHPVLREARTGESAVATGSELRTKIAVGRAFLSQAGLKKGDRCVLLAHNSIHWAALDVAAMAEGVIAVPLYARQSPAELVTMMKDCQPKLIACGDAVLADAVRAEWPAAPKSVLLEDLFAASAAQAAPPVPLATDDPVTIIYTSGTSGQAKGAILTAGNVDHMLGCTGARLDLLKGEDTGPDAVFHYLPFCFAGSWILLLSCLSRDSVLTLSTDLTRLMDEIQAAEPEYFLNVPTLLERMRAGIEDHLAKRGGAARLIFEKARAAWFRQSGSGKALPRGLWLKLANSMIFPAIRRRLGPNLKALICGSASLAVETQLFYLMLGIPVLQVYGLTETTAICTMDEPGRAEPGCVGPAIEGIEMRASEDGEILVRGPNIFPGYWNRPEETAAVLRDGWFHTGDQGEVNAQGNWRIIGRLKNLIILNSGHNVAPEPIEQKLLQTLPEAQQVVLHGTGRGYLVALVTGEVAPEEVTRALETVNAELPHYKRVRRFLIERQPLSVESGLVTVNGKLRRDAIAARYAEKIDALYGRKDP